MSKFDLIIESYEASFARHGNSPAAVLCPKGRQDRRFDVLVDEILMDKPKQSFSVLDFGCGLGHLLEHMAMRFPSFHYHGIDLVGDFIESNRARFGRRGVFEQIDAGYIPNNVYDYVFVSGTFNLSYYDNRDRNEAYVRDRMKALFGKTRRIMTCDFMSTYVDYQQPHSAHFSPVEMCRFAVEELTRRLKVRHDYMPYEFALVLYKDSEIVRPDNIYASNAMAR